MEKHRQAMRFTVPTRGKALSVAVLPLVRKGSRAGWEQVRWLGRPGATGKRRALGTPRVGGGHGDIGDSDEGRALESIMWVAMESVFPRTLHHSPQSTVHRRQDRARAD